jgi:hypothetical protein
MTAVVTGIDVAAGVQAQAEEETSRRGQLANGAIGRDGVELARLAASVDLAVRPTGDTLGVIESVDQGGEC